MSFFAPISSADRAIGGKARSLGKLRAAGFRTPAGFVVRDELFRALLGDAPVPATLDAAAVTALESATRRIATTPLPAAFTDALAAQLAALGAQRFSVRSSFAAEDREGALAAGVYESRIGVAAAGVPEAIRTVLATALSPAAVAYATRVGARAAEPPVAVLVHGYAPGDVAGTVAFDPARDDDPVVAVHGAPVIAARGTPTERIAAAVAAAARELALHEGALELEWVADGADVTFLQMRPYRAPPPPRAWSGWSAVPEAERAVWRWDAGHNPLPLSPAQAGLVAFVDARCRIGIRQRVLGGYLFYADAPDRAADAAIPPSDARPRFTALATVAERQRAALGDAPALEGALSFFAAVYEALLGTIQPAARAARRALEAFVARHAPAAQARIPSLLAGVDSIAAERSTQAARVAASPSPRARAQAIAEYLARFGDEAPAWDVAIPTFGERPTLFQGQTRVATPPAADWRRTAGQVRAAVAPEQRAAFDGVLALARDAAALGEDDDWLYARAQATVRRALLAEGRRLVARGLADDPDDAFFWPLDRLRALAAGEDPPADPRALARAGRVAHRRAVADPPPAPRAGDGLVRGAGTGGRAIGRVHRHRPGATVPPGAVLVAGTLLPTELPLLHPAAFVTDTGGPLDHVAAQARERALPAVVGAEGATHALRDGQLVLVDADAGVIVPLG